jgi:hypothetical protein
VSLPNVKSKSLFDESSSKDNIHVRSKLEALLDVGKDVILAVYSYGGLPESAATKGLMKSEREPAGKKGGVNLNPPSLALIQPNLSPVSKLASIQFLLVISRCRN